MLIDITGQRESTPANVGFRFYKSFRFGKGIRLNLSKTGVGVSAGFPGARYSVHSSGRRTTSVGIPGSGIYYRQERRSSLPRSRTELAPATVQSGAGTRLFTLKRERRFHAGLLAYMRGDADTALVEFNEAMRAGLSDPSVHLFKGLALVALGRLEERPNQTSCM